MKNDHFSGPTQAIRPWLDRLLDPGLPERSRWLWPLAAAVLCFFLANGFSYVNYFPVHDAIGFVAGGATRDWQLQLGRFLIPVYMAVRGPLSVPLLTGALSALFLGVSVSLISRMLGFRTRFQLLLTAGFLSVNLFTLEISMVHQYFADVFLLALLFCCLGVRILLNGEGLVSFLLSVFFLFVSFGLYPAFLTTAVCLLVSAAVLDTARRGRLPHSFLKRTVLHLSALLAAGVLYLVCARAVLAASGLAPASSSILSLTSVSSGELIASVSHNYQLFYRSLLDGSAFAGRETGIAACCLLLLGFFLFIRNRLQRPAKWIMVLPVLLAAVFPLISRLTNLLTGDNTAYRTAFAQFLFLPVMTGLLYAPLSDGTGGKRQPALRQASAALAVLSCLVILFSGIRYHNGAATVQKIRYDRAVYHTGCVIRDIDAFERENGPAQKVAVLGTFETPSDLDPILSRYRGIGGLGKDTGVTTEQTFFQLARVLGRVLPWRQEYTNTARYWEEAAAMPSYPNQGYIARLNDYLVVKLGPIDAQKARAAREAHPLSWTLQPGDRQVHEGETVSFQAKVDETVNYQWQYSRDGFVWQDLTNGSFWQGNRTAVLTFRAEKSHDGLLFRCTAEKWGRVLKSSPAKLTLLPQPSPVP